MASSSGTPEPIIIVRKKKKGGGGHHGGAWKVAYADFVTAMMAFFMVMWLVATMSPEQLGGIADYFKNPNAIQGKTSTLSPGAMGPGGAGDTPVKIFDNVRNPPGAGPQQVSSKAAGANGEMSQRAYAKAKALDEARRLAELKKMLEEAIAKSLAMAPFKDQLLIDLTPEGLRIQIVDAQNRPMFDLGSPALKNYTRAILVELATYFNQVDNRIAISGHTDTMPYSGGLAGYSNWELSAERANAARRALVQGGLGEEKLARVVGLSSSVLFDRADPRNPINRRISIVVLNQDAERAAAESDMPRAQGDGRAADPAPIPTAAQLKAGKAGSAALTGRTAPGPDAG